jgi:hypothetical protein
MTDEELRRRRREQLDSLGLTFAGRVGADIGEGRPRRHVPALPAIAAAPAITAAPPAAPTATQPAPATPATPDFAGPPAPPLYGADELAEIPTASGQGRAWARIPIGPQPRPDPGPAARLPGTNISAANLPMPAIPAGRDGMVFDPATNQFESASSRAQRAEADATRALRWNQSGPTSDVNRRVAADQSARRNESAAMRALRAGTAADIAKAQGTPAIGGGPAGTMAWNPKTGRYEQMGKQEVASGAGGTVAIDAAGHVSTTAPVAQPVDMSEQIKNIAGAIKTLSGNDVDPNMMLQIALLPTPEERAQHIKAITKGNPELTKLLSDRMTRLLSGQDGAVGSGQGAVGSPAAATGSLWDRSKRTR